MIVAGLGNLPCFACASDKRPLIKHAAGIAPDVFIEWSTSDPKYGDHAEIIERRWESLAVEGNANGRVTGWALLVEARTVELERYFVNSRAHHNHTAQHILTAHGPCT
jgi:Primase C terminal 2 (PriCT-2)